MAERTRVISANDLHVLLGQFLAGAEKVHIAMCLFDDDHTAQANLNGALNSMLIGAQVCAQIHGSQKHRIAAASDEARHD